MRRSAAPSLRSYVAALLRCCVAALKLRSTVRSLLRSYHASMIWRRTSLLSVSSSLARSLETVLPGVDGVCTSHRRLRVRRCSAPRCDVRCYVRRFGRSRRRRLVRSFILPTLVGGVVAASVASSLRGGVAGRRNLSTT